MRKKQTKIVATIGRKSDPKFITDLNEAGVDVMRLNTAHQDKKESLKVINNIRKVSDRLAILIDTKGPEIRVTQIDEDLSYQTGDIVKMAGTALSLKSSRDKIYVNYANFHKDMPINAVIFIDDGKMGLKIKKKNSDYLICEVINNGFIKSHKSVNVPGVHIDLPTLSKKDKDYVNFAIKHKIDFIAHSFVRNKEDIISIQKILNKYKSPIKIIAKIENVEGVKNFDEILEHAHGIMIARGDLGIEIAAEEIPLIQKEIIRKCIASHKPVIVATQMLQSMVNNPRPTRAEVSDVANAVIDGADAVMLSEESANGNYPIEAVEIMSRIVRRVEASSEEYSYGNLPILKSKNSVANYLIKAAIDATKDLDISEIIMASSSSFTAEVIAAHRGRIPVFVKCFDKTVARQLALTYGINAHYVKKEENHKKFITDLFRYLVKTGRLKAQDKVIFLASDINIGGEANFMEICEVGKYLANKTKK
ncbi:MAG: pyruvate kinase [Patescibacteria group bacterium]